MRRQVLPPNMLNLSSTLTANHRLFFLFACLLSFTASRTVLSNSSIIRDESWDTAVRKGTVLFQQLQSGCFPERKNPITLSDLMRDQWQLRGWPPRAKGDSIFSSFIAQRFGFSQGKDYITVDAVSKGT